MHLKRLALAITLTASTLVFTPASHALDTSGFVKQLETLVESGGSTFTYGNIEEDSDGTLKLYNLVIENAEKKEKTTIESLTFTNAERAQNGGLSYDSLTGTNLVHHAKDGAKISVTAIRSNDLEFANSPDSDPLPEKAGSLIFENIVIAKEGKAEKGSIKIPSIEAKGFVRTGSTNFTLESANVAPFQGRAFDDKGKPLDVSFDGLTVAGFEHFGRAGFEIDLVEFGAFSLNAVSDDGPVKVAFEGMLMNNYYAWDGVDPERPLIPDNDIKFELKPLTVSINGKEFINWKGGTGYAENDQAAQTSRSKVQFNGISFDFGAVELKDEDRKNLEPLFEMGYEKVTANIAMEGFMDLKSGILEISQMSFAFEEAGSVDMAFNVSGYTEKLAREVATLASEMGEIEDAQAQQAKGLELLAKLTPLTLQKMNLEVTDASLLNKVINLQAKKLNQEPQQVSGIVAPMASIMLAPFNIPEFATSVSSALGVFMQGNKTIKASVEPQGGLAITEAIALGSGVQAGSVQPQALIERLNLKVSAE